MQRMNVKKTEKRSVVFSEEEVFLARADPTRAFGSFLGRKEQRKIFYQKRKESTFAYKEQRKEVFISKMLLKFKLISFELLFLKS